MVDQFVSAAEIQMAANEWLGASTSPRIWRTGPEHSSGRVERFLQSCAGVQHDRCECDHSSQLLPLTAPPIGSTIPQAFGSDDA